MQESKGQNLVYIQPTDGAPSTSSHSSSSSLHLVADAPLAGFFLRHAMNSIARL